jgi:hypothetical protein
LAVAAAKERAEEAEMTLSIIKWSWRSGTCLLLLCLYSIALQGQQVIQRGAFGEPAQVLDDTGQWSTPLLVASDSDVQMYIPDVSSPDWLRKNYRDYIDHGTYVITMFTFYKTPAACRANQSGWGLGDKEHLDACLTTGYRLREARIQPQGESATLIRAAMVDQNGNIDPTSIQTQETFRVWNQLDRNSESALRKTDVVVRQQMKLYDAKMQTLR